jgi:hypothetical protein
MNENRIYYVCCYVKGREDVEIGQRKGAYTLDEAKNVFLEEDIEYLIISDKFYDFILDCYSEEITQACSDMEIKFGIT